MDNEPAKNEQFDENMPQGVEDTVRRHPEVNTEPTPGTSKKRIPSFEDIIAKQEETAEALRQEPAASADGEVENEKHVDPLETVKELKLAISKAQAELAPEEIESLLPAEDEDSSEETSLDVDSEMDTLASLRETIAEAQAQLETDETDDVEQTGQNEDPHTRLKPEENLSVSRIPRFELTEQILSEQRKVTAGRRRKPSGATQAGDRTSVHGILGEVVRAGRSRKAEEPATRQPSTSSPNIALSPAMYNILKGESRLTQSQREIISDIVTHDIEKHYTHINSAPAYKQA